MLSKGVQYEVIFLANFALVSVFSCDTMRGTEGLMTRPFLCVCVGVWERKVKNYLYNV